MKLWSKLHINPSWKGYFKYFSKGLLALGVVAVVGGLVGLSFFYGNKKADETTVNQPTQKRTVSTQASSRAQARSASSANATAGSSAPASSNTSSSSRAVMPTEIPNTGPAGWMLEPLLAAASLSLAGLKYRQSRRQLKFLYR